MFDLSATPFYLKGSGYPEGTLFPWVVSDFSPMDAIECGIVKIPRVPIASNAVTGDYPKYRNLWADIRDGLKDVRRGPEDAHTAPLLPGLLEGAPGLLTLGEKKHAVCEKVARTIIAASGGAQRLRAELQQNDPLGTTAGVSFDTIKTCWTTDPAKCHFNLVPQDSDWETAVCPRLEGMAEVRAYAKNQGIGFRIPYTCDGRAGNYYPDLIVTLDDGRGPADLLNLILEVSGQKKKEKDAKPLDVPAVSVHMQEKIHPQVIAEEIRRAGSRQRPVKLRC